MAFRIPFFGRRSEAASPDDGHGHGGSGGHAAPEAHAPVPPAAPPAPAASAEPATPTATHPEPAPASPDGGHGSDTPPAEEGPPSIPPPGASPVESAADSELPVSRLIPLSSIEATSAVDGGRREAGNVLRDKVDKSSDLAIEKGLLKLNLEQKHGLLVDLVETGLQSQLARIDIQKRGFKSFADMQLKLDIKPELLTAEDGETIKVTNEVPQPGSGHKDKKFWKNIWDKQSRFVRERILDAGKAGVVTAAVAGTIGLMGAPVTLPVVFGSYLGGQVAKSLTSYFVRERKMYGKRKEETADGRVTEQLSMAAEASQSIIRHIDKARRLAAEYSKMYDDPESTLDDKARADLTHRTFSTVVEYLNQESSDAVKEFWKADKKAKWMEMGASVLGSVAGGIAGTFTDSAVQHALESAKNTGVWMHNGQVVAPNSPDAHFVEWMNVPQNAANYPVPDAMGNVVANQSGFHYLINNADVHQLSQQLGADNFSHFYHGINHVASGHPQMITADMIKYLTANDTAFHHVLGGDPSAAILNHARGLAGEYGKEIALWAGLIGLADAGHLTLDEYKKAKNEKSGSGKLVHYFDEKYPSYKKGEGQAPGAGTPEAAPTNEVERKRVEFRELIKTPGAIFKVKFEAPPDNRLRMSEYAFTTSVPTKPANRDELSRVGMKVLDLGGEYNDQATGKYETNVTGPEGLEEQYLKGDIEFVGRLDVNADQTDPKKIVADYKGWKNYKRQLADRLNDKVVSFNSAHRSDADQTLIRTLHDNFNKWGTASAPETDGNNADKERGYVVYGTYGDNTATREQVESVIESIWKYQIYWGEGDDPETKLDGTVQLLIAVDKEKLADPAEKARIQAEYAQLSDIAQKPRSTDSARPWKPVFKIQLIPKDQEWKDYAHALAQERALARNEKYIRFIEVKGAKGSELTEPGHVPHSTSEDDNAAHEQEAAEQQAQAEREKKAKESEELFKKAIDTAPSGMTAVEFNAFIAGLNNRDNLLAQFGFGAHRDSVTNPTLVASILRTMEVDWNLQPMGTNAEASTARIKAIKDEIKRIYGEGVGTEHVPAAGTGPRIPDEYRGPELGRDVVVMAKYLDSLIGRMLKKNANKYVTPYVFDAASVKDAKTDTRKFLTDISKGSVEVPAFGAGPTTIPAPLRKVYLDECARVLEVWRSEVPDQAPAGSVGEELDNLIGLTEFLLRTLQTPAAPQQGTPGQPGAQNAPNQPRNQGRNQRGAGAAAGATPPAANTPPTAATPPGGTTS